jgi:hypothetical protein
MTDSAMEYLKNHTFVPHPEGNRMLYGLNSFGTDSNIMFKNETDVWRFVYFAVGQPKATYINQHGELRTIPCVYDDNITRMEISS